MRIIFIRHGDPDYVHDSLTEKGMREAKLLADRVVNWSVTDFYCSPLGRAQKTASYSLERLHRQATTYEWMKEFSYDVDDPVTGRHGVPWDFMPEYWTEQAALYDKDNWKETAIYQSNETLVPAYDEMCKGLDDLLARYGYERYHNYYRKTKEACPEQQTIVIFCHLGITFAMMSHLLGVSPVVLWHSFFLAPTSVTVLATEERKDDTAYFRAQVVGDTTHLFVGKEPVSTAGYFTDTFQG